jgi:hypothetical protein
LIPAVGPVGTVKKPSVVCEALFKPLWESALFADSHSGVSFHRPFFARFSFLMLVPLLSPEKYRARIA